MISTCQNDARPTLRSFSSPPSRASCWNNSDEYVHGATGSSEIRQGKINGAEKWHFRGPVPNPYEVESDVLFDAIRNDKTHNEAEYGALSTMTTIMGRMATYSGQMVKWEDALKSESNLAPDRYAWDATPSTLPDKTGRYAIAMPGVTSGW